MPLCRIASITFLSEKFLIAGGVRQGDHLFLTLFILCFECLANTLCDCSLFNGLEISGLSMKIFMFASDTLIFLNGLETNFNLF